MFKVKVRTRKVIIHVAILTLRWRLGFPGQGWNCARLELDANSHLEVGVGIRKVGISLGKDKVGIRRVKVVIRKVRVGIGEPGLRNYHLR